MQLLLEQYLRRNHAGHAAAVVELDPPSSLCLVDPVVYVPSLSLDHRFRPNIEVGTPLAQVLRPEHAHAARTLSRMLAASRDSRHLLLRDGLSKSSRLHVILHEDAGPRDAVEAMLHAVLMRRAVKKCAGESHDLEREAEMMARTGAEARRHVPSVQESLRLATWNLERVCIENRICRARW